MAVGIAASILAVLPATAAAASVDQRSDHAALTAYRSYLHGISARIPAVREAESAYVSSISNSCAGALNPLNHASVKSVNQTALFDFGEELGGGAFIVAYGPAHAPFASFAATLERLHWSSPRIARAVNRYVSAQNTLFALVPSDVCTDAQALAASGAQTIPPGTAQWVAEFAHDTTAQETASQGFAKVLEGFETPADAAVVSSDNRLLRSLTGKLKGISTSGATTLLNTLAG
ncbi:MAG TPA: hypothetical protein VMB27_05875 [Solirubrobacteraceae bacterium]|nr:hypothetical protein [Solirubrobacteraceae bacterium]